MNNVKEKAKKVAKLVDVKVEADLSGMLCYWEYKTEEERAKALERAVKDFEEFLRDHRSQDFISLDVQREYQDVCSVCNGQWEVDLHEGKTICACCGAECEQSI